MALSRRGIVTCAVFLVLWRTSYISGQLTLKSLPSILFDEANSNKMVVEGSSLWLYCEVNSVSVTISLTWLKNGRQIVQDVPHIRLRTSSSSSSTTLLLVIDNVVSSDAGHYHCIATNGIDTVAGKTANLTVMSASAPRSLQINSQSPQHLGNRTTANNGDPITLSTSASYVGGIVNNYTTPTVQWLKDGAFLRANATSIAEENNNTIKSTLTFTFQESDAGIYQCILIGSDSLIFSALSLRLDASNQVAMIDAISPPVIFLNPPEKLVMEVRSWGDISLIIWNRNAKALGSEIRVPISDFAHFFEVFVRENTTNEDFGDYSIHKSGQSAIGTKIKVVQTVRATTYLNGQDASVIVYEKENFTLTCHCTGGPLPSISWSLRGAQAPFRQNITKTKAYINSSRTVYPGQMVSTLYVTNTDYSAHDGVYTCTGRNTRDHYSSVNITVQVLVPPQIELIATNTAVYLGQNISLQCNVLRGNPNKYNFTWLHMQSNTTLLSDINSPNSSSVYISDIQSNNLGTYICSVENAAGQSTTSTIISLGRDSQTTQEELKYGQEIERDTCQIGLSPTNATAFTLTWPLPKNISNVFIVTINVTSIHIMTATSANITGSDIKGRKKITIPINHLQPSTLYTVSVEVHNHQSDIVCVAHSTAMTPPSTKSMQAAKLPLIIICGSSGGVVFLLLLIVLISACLAAMRWRKLKSVRSIYSPEITVPQSVINNKLFDEENEEEHHYDECPKNRTQTTSTAMNDNITSSVPPTSFIYSDFDKMEGCNMDNSFEDEYVEVTPSAQAFNNLYKEECCYDFIEEMYEEIGPNGKKDLSLGDKYHSQSDNGKRDDDEDEEDTYVEVGL